MITATGPAAPALKAASLEPLETCVIGCRFQRSRPVLWAITSCCPRTKPTSGVPFGATAIMPSGTRATSSAEALPAAASATAAITRNHLIPRDYLHARVESSRSSGLTGNVAGNVTDQTTRICGCRRGARSCGRRRCRARARGGRACRAVGRVRGRRRGAARSGTEPGVRRVRRGLVAGRAFPGARRPLRGRVGAAGDLANETRGARRPLRLRRR